MSKISKTTSKKAKNRERIALIIVFLTENAMTFTNHLSPTTNHYKMIHILIIGSGGREHALCWKLKQSSDVQKITCSPGNAGIAQEVTCVTLADVAALIGFCKREAVDLVVIGPEQPLVEGWADDLRAAGIATFGPSKLAAQLEGSKHFTKDLCKRYHIPTAAYGFFHEVDEAKEFAFKQSFPLVLKADGLAAGKGVIIAESYAEAEAAIDALFAQFSGGLLIEEFLTGEELSFFALSDGKTCRYFSCAQDHKRAFDGDQGPNTGGMGTFCPPPFATPELIHQVMRDIIEPTVKGMAADGMPFSGVLFAGLMLTPTGPKLLEYNARFGDPETQSMLVCMEGDLAPLLMACANGTLGSLPALPENVLNNTAAVCVVMATKGYPGDYAKGSVIKGLKEAETAEVKIFHAGTMEKEGHIIANGGRVLGVTAKASTLKLAQAEAYTAVDNIDWPEGFCRRDIGERAIN